MSIAYAMTWTGITFSILILIISIAIRDKVGAPLEEDSLKNEKIHPQ